LLTGIDLRDAEFYFIGTLPVAAITCYSSLGGGFLHVVAIWLLRVLISVLQISEINIV